MARQQLWSLDPSQRFAIRSWDDEAVVYDTKSGDTHLLEPAASALVAALRDAPRSGAELARRLAQDFEFSPDEDILALAETTLSGLRNLGLVTARPIEDR